MWERLRRWTKSPEATWTDIWFHLLATLREARHQGEDPRHSQAVGYALGVFWQADRALPTHSSTPRMSPALIRDLSVRLQEQNPNPSSSPEERYVAFTNALYRCLHANTEELYMTEEPSTMDYLAAQAAELHGACCDLVLTLNRMLLKEHEGGRRPPLLSLRQSVYDCLATLPPEVMPQLWDRLRDPSASEEFWPVVRRMRDRKAVPFLLELLPNLPPDGQAAMITALREIGDARAIPSLQVVAESGSVVAPIAKAAVAHILRHSRDDAAQLLRAADTRNAGNARETLLRPAASGATTPSNELLRPGSAPEEKG